MFLLLLAFAGASGWLHAVSEPYRGRILIEVLEELRRGGMDLIFSSAVIRPDLRIKAEPTAIAPRMLLEQLLAPLDLRTQDGPGGSILILPGARPVNSLKGRVLSLAHRTPVEGATVHVAEAGSSAVTNEAGYFEIESLFEGSYEVTIEAFGFSPATLPGVRVGSRPGPPLNVELDNHPAFVTVVVTPSRHSLVRQEQTSAHSLTSEDSALAPAVGNDVSRVVERLPGIAAADSSAAFHSRGSLAEDVSWVLDGLELYDPFHLINFQSPYSLLDTNVVDRIDFSGGGFTADLGDRHGGFVEIDTLVPGQTAAGAVELGTVNSRFAYSTPLSDPDGSWMFSARGWYPNQLNDSIQIAAGENIEPYFGDFYSKASFILSPKAMLSVHGLYVYDRLTFTETDEEDVNEVVDVLTRNSYAWLRLLTAPSSRWTQETILSFGRIDRRRDGVSAAEQRVDVDDDRKVDFFGLKHDSLWQISASHVLKGGVEVRRLEAEYRYTNILPEEPDESVFLPLDPDGTSIAAYVAHRTQVTPRFITELGLRWDRQTYTNEKQVSPRLNAVWRPTNRSELRMAVGRFHQSQRIHELHVEEGEKEFGAAETAEQAEISFQYALLAGPRIRVDAYYRKLTGLRTRYENLFEPVELFPETADDRVAISPDEARLRGLEILVRGQPDRPLFWRASYTLSSADDKIDGNYVARSWDQTHSGKFLLGFRRQDVWSAALAGAIRRGWPITPVFAEEVLNDEGELENEATPGARNTGRYPDYYRVDFQARRAFPVRSGKIWLTVDITNLTNRENARSVDDFVFEPQADGSVDVRTDFDHWLGRTGSFSILWEFHR